MKDCIATMIDIENSNILIVDDIPDNLKLLKNLLSSFGYKVRPALNGKDALEAVEKQKPDLILLDIMMPEMDGFEVCKKLKENDDTKDIPVIFLTAKVGVSDLKKGFDLGAVDYIKKPFNKLELKVRVDTHIKLGELNRLLKEDNYKKDLLLIQQSKMATMGEMIDNIAHQWRQPLSVISSSATGGKLQNELGLLNNSNINSYFDTINDTAQYLSQTIDDFRGFFNPINNKISEFNISETLIKTLSLVKAQFSSKSIELIQSIEDFELSSIQNELIQVLINILNNSRDALLKLENQRRLIFINTYKKDNKLIIEIKDNANGIPENIIDRIFEPYFTTKHKSQGTGIGLYMSEEMIRVHLNGSIIVSNEKYSFEGHDYIGAKFTIIIGDN